MTKQAHNNNTRRISPILALFWLALAAPVGAETISIAAIVGDDVITTADVRARRDVIMATAGIENTVENQQKLMPRILQSLVDETLQMQEAKRQSVTVSDDELEKATAAVGVRGDTGQRMREFIRARGLSEASFEKQIRAQLAWGKVVQRRLRRNVTVSQDEILRAQKAQASSPGETELHISALRIEAPDEATKSKAEALAKTIIVRVKAGAGLQSAASGKHPGLVVKYNPPIWVGESSLPPALQEVLKPLSAGEVTPPLPDPGMVQIVQLLERGKADAQADTTEYALKQITFDAPKPNDKSAMTALRQAVEIVRAMPGDCESEAVGQASPAPKVAFVRTTLGALTPEQRKILSHLDVGVISQPLLGPSTVRLVMVCEKVEPAAGALPDAEKIRQQLYNEKLELEAQRLLRNLRRDAFIEIKGAS